ncbi:MAG: toxin-antitoxin system YwqK family antitoxin [Calditrichia bacterium]
MKKKNDKRSHMLLSPLVIAAFLVGLVGVYTFCELVEQPDEADLQVPNIMVNWQDPLVKIERGLVFYNNMLFSGRLFQRTGQGAPISEERYLNGLRHGISRRWHAGGMLAYVHQYEFGKKQGEQVGWWRNGNARYRYSYVDNLQHGKSIEYHQHGDPSRVSNFDNGIENGYQRNWDIDGFLTANYFVKGGRRYGQVVINRFHSGELTQLAANVRK